MSLAQALAEGLRVTVIGLIIVFAVLVILMLVMMAMKKIFYKEEKPNTKPEPKTKPEIPQPAKPEMNEDELVAVITAAIAASLNTSTYRLHVKSFKRAEDTSPSWNRAGRSEVIESRF